MNRPICSICNRTMGAAGGVVGTDIMFWKCWDCGEEVEDCEFEVVENQLLVEYLKK